MFRPELKNTAWDASPEVIFEITGENYQESRVLKNTFNKELTNLINDSLIIILWDLMTISELEEHIGNSISKWNNGEHQLRLEFIDGIVFGWVHYKDVKNKTNTFRFKLDMKGEFSKC